MKKQYKSILNLLVLLSLLIFTFFLLFTVAVNDTEPVKISAQAEKTIAAQLKKLERPPCFRRDKAKEQGYRLAYVDIFNGRMINVWMKPNTLRQNKSNDWELVKPVDYGKILTSYQSNIDCLRSLKAP